MAAYAALLSLSQVIDQTLLQSQEYALPYSREQMMSLKEELGRLQGLLEHLSGRSHPSIDELESRIRDAAYQLEDIIEGDIAIIDEDDIPRFSVAKIPSPVAKTPSAFDSCARKIGILLEEAMAMKEHNLQVKHTPGASHPFTAESSSSEPSTAKLDFNQNEIMDWIFGRDSNLETVPITGMGGIGKTTLARAIYEHPNTKRHFDICSWVTISQECNVKEILCGLVPSDQQDVPDDRLTEFVHKSLYGRRYLIVLDDIWDLEAWYPVRRALPHNHNGSRIILTTRLLRLAECVGDSAHVHRMKLLNEDQGWDLLREKVGGNKHRSKELEDLGRTISRNCRGLPLALVAIAGLLKLNMSRKFWEEIAENTIAPLMKDDSVLRVLSLSYTNLPPHLKACFLYMGAFREDDEIPTKELVMLWTAEGFVKPSPSREMEDVAEYYLKELVNRSLVMVKKIYNWRIKACSIHSLLREFCLRKAKEEKFLHPFTDKDVDEVTFRRVSFSTNDLLSPPCDNFNLKIKVLRRVKGNQNFLNSILCSRLTNLRYLHFVCDNNIDSPFLVPESILNLKNLETLIISSEGSPCNDDGYRLVLPVEIWDMPRLSHIMLMSNSYLPSPVPTPHAHPVLESLQTLIGVTVSDLGKSIIERVPNLKELKVEYKNGTVDVGKDFHVINLVDLKRLETLAVSCDLHPSQRVREFLLPLSLKKLTLKGTRIPWVEMSVVGSLPNLEVLKLKRGSCIGKVWKPVEDGFARLRYLKMEELLIKHWMAEMDHFPYLQKLVILSCSYLEEIPLSIGEICTLEKLIVKGRARVDRSAREIQQKQVAYGNDHLEFIALR